MTLSVENPQVYLVAVGPLQPYVRQLGTGAVLICTWARSAILSSVET